MHTNYKRLETKEHMKNILIKYYKIFFVNIHIYA